MIRVENRLREGMAVQWDGWNENDIRELYKQFAPKVSVTLVPVTDDTGVRTLDLYVLLLDSATDFVVFKGDWFVGHGVGVTVPFVTILPESSFLDIYEQKEL